MHQGGSLQSMLAALPAHLPGRDPMHFPVYHFHQPARRSRLAISPILEQTGNVVGVIGHYELY